MPQYTLKSIMVPANRKQPHESKYLSILIERSGRMSTKLIGTLSLGRGMESRVWPKRSLTQSLKVCIESVFVYYLFLKKYPFFSMIAAVVN